MDYKSLFLLVVKERALVCSLSFKLRLSSALPLFRLYRFFSLKGLDVGGISLRICFNARGMPFVFFGRVNAELFLPSPLRWEPCLRG